MLPLYRDPWFTFRFADERIIDRIHLEGVPCGQAVSIFRLNAQTGERLELLAHAVVGPAGWVELPTPLVVHAGDGFVAEPTSATQLTLETGSSTPDPPAQTAPPKPQAPRPS